MAVFAGVQYTAFRDFFFGVSCTMTLLGDAIDPVAGSHPCGCLTAPLLQDTSFLAKAAYIAYDTLLDMLAKGVSGLSAAVSSLLNPGPYPKEPPCRHLHRLHPGARRALRQTGLM